MLIKMKSRREFASTLWGNISPGQIFEVAPGYAADLEAQGVADRVDQDTAKRAAIESLRSATGRRRK